MLAWFCPTAVVSNWVTAANELPHVLVLRAVRPLLLVSCPCPTVAKKPSRGASETVRLSNTDVILIPDVADNALSLFCAPKVVPNTVWKTPPSATDDKSGWYVVASSLLGIIFGADMSVVRSMLVDVKVQRTIPSVWIFNSGVPDFRGTPSIRA